MLINSLAQGLFKGVIGRSNKEIMQVNEIKPPHFPSRWIAYGVLGLNLIPAIVVGAPLKLLLLATNSVFQKQHKIIVNGLLPTENQNIAPSVGFEAVIKNTLVKIVDGVLPPKKIEDTKMLSLVRPDNTNLGARQNAAFEVILKEELIKFFTLKDMTVLSRVNKYWRSVLQQAIPNWLKINGLSLNIKALRCQMLQDRLWGTKIVSGPQLPMNKRIAPLSNEAFSLIALENNNSSVQKNVGFAAIVKNELIKFLKLGDLNVLSRVNKSWWSVMQEMLPKWLNINGVSPKIKTIQGISIQMKQLCHPGVWTALSNSR